MRKVYEKLLFDNIYHKIDKKDIVWLAAMPTAA